MNCIVGNTPPTICDVYDKRYAMAEDTKVSEVRAKVQLSAEDTETPASELRFVLAFFPCLF